MHKTSLLSVATARISLAVCVAILLLSSAGTAFAGPAKCDVSESTAWMRTAFETWSKIRKDDWGLKDTGMPWLIFFDRTCVFQVNPEAAFLQKTAGAANGIEKKWIGAERFDVLAAPHSGKIALPESGEIPAALLSFAAPYGKSDRSFLIFALPPFWHDAPHLKGEKNIDVLILSVFAHEMTHTNHRNFFSRLDAIEKKYPHIKDLDDDVIQNTFGENEEFRKAFGRERDLLVQVIEAKDLRSRRSAAKEAYDAIIARRNKFFTGDKAGYAEIEDIFLTMEGAANWAGVQAAVKSGMSETDAVGLIRRGKRWSQDEGLELFLAVDLLLPNWQKRTFRDPNASVVKMLGEAVK